MPEDRKRNNMIWFLRIRYAIYNVPVYILSWVWLKCEKHYYITKKQSPESQSLCQNQKNFSAMKELRFVLSSSNGINLTGVIFLQDVSVWQLANVKLNRPQGRPTLTKRQAAQRLTIPIANIAKAQLFIEVWYKMIFWLDSFRPWLLLFCHVCVVSSVLQWVWPRSERSISMMYIYGDIYIFMHMWTF